MINNFNENNIQCRICLDEELKRSDVIAPCKCSGTQKYVHRTCLESWREVNKNNHLYSECQLCKFKYRNQSTPLLNYIPYYDGPYQNNNESITYMSCITTWYTMFQNTFMSIIVIQTISILMFIMDSNVSPNALHKFHKINEFYSTGIQIIYFVSVESIMVLLTIVFLTNLCFIRNKKKYFTIVCCDKDYIFALIIASICILSCIWSPMVLSILFSLAYSLLLSNHSKNLVKLNRYQMLNTVMDVEDISISRRNSSVDLIIDTNLNEPLV